eukprot:m.194930 g.194930  ORF g.194930 m.194930 type:complete len:536 (-) comp32543_c4_seq3:72-1679(-)
MSRRSFDGNDETSLSEDSDDLDTDTDSNSETDQYTESSGNDHEDTDADIVVDVDENTTEDNDDDNASSSDEDDSESDSMTDDSSKGEEDAIANEVQKQEKRLRSLQLLQSKGIIPAGQRLSSLAQVQQRCNLSQTFQPQLSQSGLKLKEIEVQHVTNQARHKGLFRRASSKQDELRIAGRQVTTCIELTLISAQAIELMATSQEVCVCDRWVLVALVDGDEFVSNIHKVAGFDDVKQHSRFGKDSQHAEEEHEWAFLEPRGHTSAAHDGNNVCVIRCNNVTPAKTTLVLEMGYTITLSDGSNLAISCGWTQLELPNIRSGDAIKPREIQLHDGITLSPTVPIENVEVGASLRSTFSFRRTSSASVQPRIKFKFSPIVGQEDIKLTNELPDVVIIKKHFVGLLSTFRNIILAASLALNSNLTDILSHTSALFDPLISSFLKICLDENLLCAVNFAWEKEKQALPRKSRQETSAQMQVFDKIVKRALQLITSTRLASLSSPTTSNAAIKDITKLIDRLHAHTSHYTHHTTNNITNNK